MKKSELDKALYIARSGKSLSMDDLAMFDGFALPNFKPITCTVEALAMLVRWQCVRFNGTVDNKALDEIARCGKHKFTVLGAEDELDL